MTHSWPGGVEGVSTKVEFIPEEAVKGRYFGRCGGGGSPRAEHVKGEFGCRQEEVPQIRGKCDVGGGEAGD